MENLTFENFVYRLKRTDSSRFLGFAGERLHGLKSEPGKAHLATDGFQHGFINKSLSIGEDKFLDDKKIYADYARYMREEPDHNIYSVLWSTQKFISKDEFYQDNKAQNFERTALVQNLLSFAGIPSTMVIGKLGLNWKDQRMHAFNMLDDDGKKMLFDPTNPILYKKDGREIFAPAVMTNVSLDKSTVFDCDFANKSMGYKDATLVSSDRREYFYPEKFLAHAKLKNDNSKEII